MSDRKYLHTERAHYMCPNMHFGIVAEIVVEFDGTVTSSDEGEMEWIVHLK